MESSRYRLQNRGHQVSQTEQFDLHPNFTQEGGDTHKRIEDRHPTSLTIYTDKMTTPSHRVTNQWNLPSIRSAATPGHGACP